MCLPSPWSPSEGAHVLMHMVIGSFKLSRGTSQHLIRMDPQNPQRIWKNTPASIPYWNCHVPLFSTWIPKISSYAKSSASKHSKLRWINGSPSCPCQCSESDYVMVFSAQIWTGEQVDVNPSLQKVGSCVQEWPFQTNFRHQFSVAMSNLHDIRGTTPLISSAPQVRKLHNSEPESSASHLPYIQVQLGKSLPKSNFHIMLW